MTQMTAQEHVQQAEELLAQAAKKGTPAPVVAGHATRATAHATLALYLQREAGQDG